MAKSDIVDLTLLPAEMRERIAAEVADHQASVSTVVATNIDEIDFVFYDDDMTPADGRRVGDASWARVRNRFGLEKQGQVLKRLTHDSYLVLIDTQELVVYEHYLTWQPRE